MVIPEIVRSFLKIFFIINHQLITSEFRIINLKLMNIGLKSIKQVFLKEGCP